jgi:pheromone a factor receptor
MAYYIFTSACCLGWLLSILLGYFSYRSRGQPLSLIILIGWTFTLNFLLFLDSILWRSEDIETWWDGRIYCDVNSRLKSAFPIGAPGAAIGMFRFLAQVSDQKISAEKMEAKRVWNNAIDVVLGVAIPVVVMGLKLFVPWSRYSILGVIGCVGGTKDIWLAIPLYHIWTPGLTMVAAGYACTLLS